MKDQKLHWNNAHRERKLGAHSDRQTGFAEEVNGQIPAGCKLLELGCGEGNDSLFFAKAGHKVTATDFSDIAIAHNNQRYKNERLRFVVQDISEPLAFPDNSFDVVYARLSLHYFSDSQTHGIFQEITRVLKPGGKLYFMCKSTDDPLYGQGEKDRSRHV